MDIAIQDQLLIRGVTASAGGALFVVPAQADSPELFISKLGNKQQDRAGTITQQITQFYVEKQRFPKTIQTEHQCYSLGITYDEALQSEIPVVTIPKPSRANVVCNRIAIVTGGAQGIGEGLVRGLIEEGAFVWVADMNKSGADNLVEQLNLQQGATVAKSVEVNVTSEESVSKMIDTVVSECGGFDIFISNAGVLKAGSVKEMSLADFSFVTNVDYTGFFICTKHAARALSIQNSTAPTDYWSDIIGISSKSGLEGSKKNGAYAGAKFGTLGLTQSFALELVEDNIKVNSICPGNFLDGPLWSDPKQGLFVQYLNTGKVPGAKTLEDVRTFYEEKVPMKRGCQAEDLVRAILYTVEQRYETGQAIPVTGGQVMLN